MNLDVEQKAPLVEHLIELRNRLMISVGAIIVGFILCYSFSEQIFEFLAAPLHEILGPQAKMIYTALHEAFFTQIKVSFFAGLFLAMPVLFTQMWLFIAPGLYQHERSAILPFLFVTPVLFFMGGTLAYYFVFPLAFKFFLGFQSSTIEALPSMREYLSLVIKLIIAFGITFELPVGLLLAIKAGVVSTAGLVDKRKYNIVLAFVAAAILTPPDPFTQVMLAIPIMLMYEISIFFGRGIERKRAEQEAAEEAQWAADHNVDDDDVDHPEHKA
ncbi:Sec-independent protein translocase TatC [Magnetococcus marinus MC-1]|uniref:Sec-independent protein translocase protein TatC n=1 Tax=Magnetococcus marinus (strain ATCC BAA-1437 / JCM 17883 / MC-1) TaxID=156889 RepID=TATC_MAGMM|nr:twin-arginine translocase subunit TatC [Magnetococcus marinus]A0L833.1 RecName: Full=Sec-independent protein translocase protein TatC [Magnetococcus marinus MC-1]ABK44126.1 Sec-independent protein translocase TatC [Magnetococcus marinus MC-1]